MGEQRIITASGIPVYTYLNPSSSGFFLSLFVRSGCMYEGEDECGITHFLEHVSIRNVNALMNGELYSTLDRYGIEFNASTFSEMVQFYTSGATENFSHAAPIFARLFDPIVLSSSQIDAERERIRAEIREADDPGSITAFTSECVFRGTPLARSITGTRGSVSRIGKRRLEEYRRRIFVPGNVFVYITGNVSQTDLDIMLRALDGVTLYSGEPNSNLAPVPTDFMQRGGGVFVKNASYTGIRFSFDIDMTLASVPELDLLYDAMLCGYSSPLFMELSEGRGLCYDLSGTTERYKNIGVLSFGFETREARLCEAVEVCLDILNRMKEVEYWARAPLGASYVDNCMMLYDDARDLNFTFAYDNYLLGLGYRDLADRRRAYQRVTPRRLAELCRQIFRGCALTVTVRGNKRRIDLDKIKSICKTL